MLFCRPNLKIGNKAKCYVNTQHFFSLGEHRIKIQLLSKQHLKIRALKKPTLDKLSIQQQYSLASFKGRKTP